MSRLARSVPTGAGNELRGRVVGRKSGAGIPDLVVTVTALAPRRREGAAAGGGDGGPVRVGSVATDADGIFVLPWTRDDAPARAVLRVDVTEDGGEEVLASRSLEGAARLETVLLRVDDGVVERRDRAPDAAAAAASRVEAGRTAAKAHELLREESGRALGARLGSRLQLRTRARGAFTDFARRVASRDGAAAVPDDRRVPPEGSVAEVAARAIREGIEQRIEPAVALGAAVVDDELEMQAEVTAEDMAAMLRPAGERARVMRVRRDPLARICAEHHRSADPCVRALEFAPGGGDGDGDPGGGDGEPPVEPDGDGEPPVEPDGDGAAPTPAALPVLVDRLVGGMGAPEDPRIFRVASRAGMEDIDAGVNGFALRAGPADVPAHHEFHHLQMAFDPVWQRLENDGVLRTGAALLEGLGRLGIDPEDVLDGSSDLPDMVGFLRSGLNDDSSLLLVHPPTRVIREFDITPQQWSLLVSIDREKELDDIAKSIEDLRVECDAELAKISAAFADLTKVIPLPPELVARWKESVRERFEPAIREARARGQRVVDYADHALEAPDEFTHFHELLGALEELIKEPYEFTVYAANERERSVNFGLVATYVQRWEPVSYQVGRLVKTVTLAPKEVRRFSKRVSVRRSRSDRELESSMNARRAESSETSRVEAEIVRKATNRTNFQAGAEGGVNVGIASARASTAFAQDAAAESQETKRQFREAVFKASEEYRAERSVEVNLTASEETTLEESGEISNPNDELPVTYLFYELQRRYRVSEKIRRLTPVVLVAQEFPKPSDIDDDWIVAHDWILRRVILDDSFVPAMDYLATRVVGDEFALREQYQNLQQHRRLVDELKTDLVAVRADVGRRYAALQRSVTERADAIEAESSEGFLSGGVEFLLGDFGADPEAMRVREEAARDAYERAAREEKDLLARLEREQTALTAITEAYTKALSEHLNRKAQIARLRVHVKQNAMYYMQAIWSHEPPDQRFFRLHRVEVPKLEGKVTYTVEPDPDAAPVPPLWKKPKKLVAKVVMEKNAGTAPLAEVADLDTLLGFKGNYMIFPLKDSNVLTDFLMTPYLDAAAGLRDPDVRGNWTLSEFVDYVCCLREHLSPAEFAELRPRLVEAYRELLSDPGADGEEIVTPTDSLFIEALPGAHPILEDFKLMHRAVDAKRAQAGVRAAELENLRAAARILGGDLEDPQIDKRIVIEGDTDAVVPEG